MIFDKYVQEFDLDKDLDENFKKNAFGTTGLAILEMVQEGNIVKIANVEGEETEIEDLIDVKVEDEDGKQKTVKEKGKRKVYRVTVGMLKVPKSALKLKSCSNPFQIGTRNVFNPRPGR